MKLNSTKIFLCIFIAIVLFSTSFFTVQGKELPVLSENVITDTFSTSIKNDSYILYEMGSNTVIAHNNENEKLAPASITKIMTLILIYDAISSGEVSCNDMVTVSEHAASMGGSQIFLEPGEELSVTDMIKSIVISSANDACVAMAEYVGGTENNFVNLMNEKAEELGMYNTHFVNSCGLDADNHYSSAFDIAVMSDYLLENYPQIMEYTLTWMDSIVHNTAKGSKEFGLTNTNKLVKTYDGITGLKTGSTGNAGYSVSASATRNNTSLIAVVLGADTTQNRFILASDLLNFGFAEFKTFQPEEHCLVKETDFKRSRKGRYKLWVENPKPVLVEKQFDESNVTYEYTIDNMTLPVMHGEKCGTLTVMYNGNILAEYDLVTEEDILNIRYVDYLSKLLQNF